MRRVAIIGGGPGGLFTAYLLERKYPGLAQTTIFEATDRIGGKIQTRRFDTAPVTYEAGVAECYDYTVVSRDPQRELVAELDLPVAANEPGGVILDGRVLRDDADILRWYGEATLGEIVEFRRRARELLPLDMWTRATWEDDNRHKWALGRCEQLLRGVRDTSARRYLRVAAHSDVAAEPYQTSGLNGLKNFVMDLPGYVRQHSIRGCMERLPERLAERLQSTRIELRSRAARVGRTPGGRYRVETVRHRRVAADEFDAVFVALPHAWLNAVDWAGERLSHAMARHIGFYDHPGHYLRVSMLFRAPFWRGVVQGSWFMLDAFGGCCVYDEGSRQDAGTYGVLGWLLAGSSALALANLDDASLTRRVLEALPNGLYERGVRSLLESKTHRWVGAVSAQPGGLPARDPRHAHVPEALEHPELFAVGDYLFDCTLNGVFESADLATGLWGDAAEDRRGTVGIAMRAS